MKNLIIGIAVLLIGIALAQYWYDHWRELAPDALTFSLSQMSTIVDI